MTSIPVPVWEKGKTYQLNVLFDSKCRKTVKERYLNVQDKRSGRAYKVEVNGNPIEEEDDFKCKDIDFICTEVTEGGPEFALASKYFPSVPQTKRGSNLGLQESAAVEFKTSLIYSPSTSQPDGDQPYEIAKQIAAMMNTEGGMLFMGVNDDGFVTGIEKDFPVLANAPIRMNQKTDENWSYHANLDGYKRKLMNAVIAYLGEDVPSFLNNNITEVRDALSGLTYLKIFVPASERPIYFAREEYLIYRAGASLQYLHGRARDLYVQSRFYPCEVKSLKRALELCEKRMQEKDELIEKLNDEKAKWLAKGNSTVPNNFIKVTGKNIIVEKNTCLPLDKKALEALNKPCGFSYKIDDVSQKQFRPSDKGKCTWEGLYENLLEFCAILDPQKFNSLPETKEFAEGQRKRKNSAPYFVRRGNRAHLKSASDYLGPNNDIRADLRCGTKVAFLDEKSVPRRIMAYFGIAANDFRIWIGNK